MANLLSKESLGTLNKLPINLLNKFKVKSMFNEFNFRFKK